MKDGQDHCPYCGQAFEIICVKFAASGVRTVSRCPNCALAPTEPVTRSTLSINFGRAVHMIQPLNSRFKIVVLFAIAAVLVAGVLRHTLHTYGGISPADIRWDSLLLVSVLAIAAVVFNVLRSRR